jgi:hypothetical protein
MILPTVDAARLALAPYLLWVKLAALALIVALIFGVGWKAGASLTESRWLRAAAKQAADYQSSLAHAREAERASYAKRDGVSNALQKDLAAVTAERDRLRGLPARIVRVYVPAAPAASMSANGGAAAGHSGAPAGTPALAGPPGPDIGRGLYDLADDSDAREAELGARLSRCVEGWTSAAGR